MPIVKDLNMTILVGLLGKIRYPYIANRPGDCDIKEAILQNKFYGMTSPEAAKVLTRSSVRTPVFKNDC
jgi:hypothetical protein